MLADLRQSERGALRLETQRKQQLRQQLRVRRPDRCQGEELCPGYEWYRQK